MEQYNSPNNIHNYPDKEFENFWLNLKDFINELSSIEITIICNNLSNELNEHQKNKEYNIIFYKINDFLNKNIKKISVILISDFNNSKNLSKKFIKLIKKWTQLLPKFNTDVIEYDLLRFSKKINTNNDTFKKILDYINTNDLNKFFQYSLDSHNVYILDLLKKYIDINEYIESCIYKNLLDTLNGSCLIDVLKEEKLFTNI
jgi:hypothetical protein